MKCVYLGQTSHALSVLRSFCYFKLETSIYMLRFSTVVFRPGTMVNRVVPGFASRFAYSTCFTLIWRRLRGNDLSTIMKQARQKRGRKKSKNISCLEVSRVASTCITRFVGLFNYVRGNGHNKMSSLSFL